MKTSFMLIYKISYLELFIVIVKSTLIYPGPPNCAACGDLIYDRTMIRIKDKVMHGACLRCTSCNQQVTEMCFSDGNEVYCQYDFHRYDVNNFMKVTNFYNFSSCRMDMYMGNGAQTREITPGQSATDKGDASRIVDTGQYTTDVVSDAGCGMDYTGQMNNKINDADINKQGQITVHENGINFITENSLFVSICTKSN